MYSTRLVIAPFASLSKQDRQPNTRRDEPDTFTESLRVIDSKIQYHLSILIPLVMVIYPPLPPPFDVNNLLPQATCTLSPLLVPLFKPWNTPPSCAHRKGDTWVAAAHYRYEPSALRIKIHKILIPTCIYVFPRPRLFTFHSEIACCCSFYALRSVVITSGFPHAEVLRSAQGLYLQ